MEKDDEVKNNKGSSYDFGARIYDPRVGRWFSVDASTSKKSDLSPYQGFLGNPILFVDPDGNDEFLSIVIDNKQTGEKIIIRKNTAISTRSMAGKTYWSEYRVFKQQVYHDFRTIITVTIDEEGKQYIKQTTYKLKDGKSIVNNVIFGDSEGELIDLGESTWEGSGEEQRGGITLISKDGGASPTKTRSLSATDETDIGDLLTALGALNGAKFSDLPGGFDAIPDIIEKMKSVTEELKSDTEGGGYDAGDDSVVVVEHQVVNGDTTVITSTQSREDAERYIDKNSNSTNDTISVPPVKP